MDMVRKRDADYSLCREKLMRKTLNHKVDLIQLAFIVLNSEELRPRRTKVRPSDRQRPMALFRYGPKRMRIPLMKLKEQG